VRPGMNSSPLLAQFVPDFNTAKAGGDGGAQRKRERLEEGEASSCPFSFFLFSFSFFIFCLFVSFLADFFFPFPLDGSTAERGNDKKKKKKVYTNEDGRGQQEQQELVCLFDSLFLCFFDSLFVCFLFLDYPSHFSFYKQTHATGGLSMTGSPLGFPRPRGMWASAPRPPHTSGSPA